MISCSFSDDKNECHLEGKDISSLTVSRRVPRMEQELLTLQEHPSSPSFFSWRSCCSICLFLC